MITALQQFDYHSLGYDQLVAACEARDAEIKRLNELVADHEEVHRDHHRLVRELDVLLNGEAGAAKQASLCDIVGQLAAQKRHRPSKTEVDDVQWKDGVPYVRGLMLNYDELAAYAFRLREFKASAAEPAGDEFHQLWQMLADDCNATPCEWFQLRDGLHRWLRTKGKESALKTTKAQTDGEPV